MGSVSYLVVGLAIFLLTIVLAVSIPANIAILYVFFKEKTVRVPSSIFVINLAIVCLLGSIAFPFLLTDKLIGKPIISANRIACLAGEFVNEFFTALSLFSLLLVTANRYSIVLLKHKYSTCFTKHRSLLYIAVVWLTSICYAASLTGYQVNFTSLSDFKCNLTFRYPRDVAALQFAFLGIPFTLTLATNGALAFYFYQQRHVLPLPVEFYSKESIERRMAPMKNRRITKNLRVILLTVTSLCTCYMIYLGCLVLAMLTGKFVRIAYISSVTMVYVGCAVHPYLYGYLNKRLKQPLRRAVKRMRNRLTCSYKDGEGMVTRMNSFSFSSSKMRFVNSETDISVCDGTELTRSKMARPRELTVVQFN